MKNDQWLSIKKMAKHFGLEDGKDKLIEERCEFEKARFEFEKEPNKHNLEQIIFEAVDEIVVLLRLIMSYTLMVIKDEKKAITFLSAVFKNALNYKIDRTVDWIDSRYYE